METKPLPTRIAFYVHTLFNGGVERVLFSLAKELLSRGVKVDLVVDQLDYSPMADEIPAGVRLVKLEATSFFSRLPRLLNYLRTEKPHSLLSAGHFANEIAILAKLFCKYPLRSIVSIHTTLSTELRSLSIRSPRRHLVPLLGRFLYRFTDVVVGVSDGVRDDTIKLFKLKDGLCRTIYNPLDVDHVRSLANEPLVHPWFVPGAPPVIIALGRLEHQKDFPMLLKAFSAVAEKTEARLLILGEGSQRLALETLVGQLKLSERVLLPGFIANPFPFLAKSAVFAVSSRWEGLSIALIEALAVGVPIISTDCPSGASEILDKGRYGSLVPVGDADGLAAGILHLLGTTRVKTPEEALARYTVDHVVNQYLEVLS